MSKIRDWPSFCHTISEIAEFVRDSEHNIQEFIREDRIPYIVVPDGILIPLGGFQCCMPDLYPDMMLLVTEMYEKNRDGTED